jgi:hypothetical protein
MKYSILLASLLSTLPIIASAEDLKNFIRFDGVYYAFRNTPYDKYGFNLAIGREFSPGLKIDLRQEFRAEEETQKIGNRLESGFTYDHKFNSVTVSVRTALGERYASADNWEYYSVAPELIFPVANNIKFRAGYRYRNAFDTSKMDETHTYRGTVEYAYSQSSTIGATLGYNLGDAQFLFGGINLGYKF